MPQTFVRQLGLQAIMWGLFVAALVGAVQVSQMRGSALQIGSLDSPVQFGWLKIAMPTGWAVKVDPQNLQIEAIERPQDGIHRVLFISQEPLSEPPRTDYLSGRFNHELTPAPLTFAGLHATGEISQGVRWDTQTGAAVSEYVAAVVLPNNVAVLVELRDVPGFGPSGRESFQKIIDALQPASGRTPRLLHFHGPYEPIGNWSNSPPAPRRSAAAGFLLGCQ